jgi:hypothetical protein
MEGNPRVTTKRIKTDTAVSVKEFRCDDCGSGFTRRINLFRHVQALHRPAVCGSCGTRVSSMAEHECKQSGQRLHACQSCDYKSKRKHDIKRHWETLHSAEARARITARRRRELRLLIRSDRKKHQEEAARRLAAVKKRHDEENRKAERRHGRAINRLEALLSVSCPICKNKFRSKVELSAHVEVEHHPTSSELTPGTSAEELYGLGRSAFGKTIAEYVKRYQPNTCADPFFLFVDDNSADILSYHLAKSKVIRVHTSTEILMQHVSDGGESVNYEMFTFYTPPRKLYLENDLLGLASEFFDDMRRILFDRLANFEDGSGSGWRISYIASNSIRVNKVPHLHEGRAGHLKKRSDAYIKKKFYMPSQFENPPSRDKDCFYAAVCQYYVGRARLESSGKNRIKNMVGSAAQIQRFMRDNIEKNIGRPAKMRLIGQFEEAHRHTLNFKINVFGHDGSMNSIYPMRPSKRAADDEAKDTINLLLLELDEGPHYVLIRDICKVVKRKYNSQSMSRHELCPHCMTVVSGKKALETHSAYCGLNKPQRIQMAPRGSKMKFQSFNKLFKTNLFCVADFEAKMQEVGPERGDTAKMHFIEEQVPVSYCLAVFDRFGDVLFRREESHETDCLNLFFLALDDAATICRERLQTIVPHSLDSREASVMKKNADKCMLCQGTFNPLKIDHSVSRVVAELGRELNEVEKKQFDSIRVIDHDHMTGEFAV